MIGRNWVIVIIFFVGINDAIAGEPVPPTNNGNTAGSIGTSIGIVNKVRDVALKSTEATARMVGDTESVNVLNSKALKKYGNTLKGIGVVAKTYSGYKQEGAQGAFREAGQAGTELFVEEAGARIAGSINPLFEFPFRVGFTAGTIINEIPGVKDAVTNFEYDYIYEPIHTYMTTGYMSPVDAGAAEQRRHLHKRKMEELTQKNLEYSMNADEQTMLSPGQSYSPESTSNDYEDFIKNITTSILLYQTSSDDNNKDVGKSSASCQLDPETGCHIGHDEGSHPGGCKEC